jgi:hypothetical protein
MIRPHLKEYLDNIKDCNDINFLEHQINAYNDIYLTDYDVNKVIQEYEQTTGFKHVKHKSDSELIDILCEMENEKPTAKSSDSGFV